MKYKIPIIIIIITVIILSSTTIIAPGADYITLAVKLSWDNATTFTTAKTQNFPCNVIINDYVKQYGSTSDDWGHTWTPDETNNTNFVFDMENTAKSGGANTIQVDQVRIEITYTVSLPCNYTSGNYNIDCTQCNTTDKQLNLTGNNITFYNPGNYTLIHNITNVNKVIHAGDGCYITIKTGYNIQTT